MLSVVLLLEALGFAQFGIRLLECYIERVSRLLAFFLPLLALQFQLAIVPAENQARFGDPSLSGADSWVL